MNQTLKGSDRARGKHGASGIKISSPHCAGARHSVLQAFIHQENGRATNGQNRSSAGQKKALYNLKQLCKWWREALEIQMFSKTVQEWHVPGHWMHQCSWYLLCRRQEQSETLLFLFQKMNENLISPDPQRELNFLKPCPTVMRIKSNKSYLYLMWSRGTKL